MLYVCERGVTSGNSRGVGLGFHRVGEGILAAASTDLKCTCVSSGRSVKGFQGFVLGVYVRGVTSGITKVVGLGFCKGVAVAGTYWRVRWCNQK